jgi:hypothetical protein
MMWRTMADEVEDHGGSRAGVDGRQRRDYNGADDYDKKQQSTCVRRQRRITTMAGERWGTVVELEEQLFGGRRQLKRRGG